MTILLVVRSIAFVLFFSAIGVWYVSFLPIVIGLLLVMYMSDQGSSTDEVMSKEQVKQFFLRHAFAFARCCIMLGARGIADIFGASLWMVSLRLVGLNIFLWILSYTIEYEDGKEMFEIGYWISSFIALGTARTVVGNMMIFAELLMSWLSLTMALYAFIVFIGSALEKKVSHRMTYPLFILVMLSMMFLIYHYTKDDVVLSLVSSQMLLMALYCGIFGVYWYHDQLVDRPIEPSTSVLRTILAGRPLFTKKSLIPFQTDIVHDAWAFLERLDDKTKFTISFFNIALIIGQVWVFLSRLGSGQMVIEEILLWFGIVAFFVNYLLLRQIGFYHTMQRVVAFVLVNFGIYLSVVNMFGVDPVYLVSIGTIWSIVNSLVMFHTGWLRRKGFLGPRDYLYRIGTNGLVTLCNIYFMFLLPLSLQLRFFLALMYFGVQLFLTLYNVRYVNQR